MPCNLGNLLEWAKSSTSLKANHFHDINNHFTFSRCISGTFCSEESASFGKLTQKRGAVFITLLI